MDGSRRVLLLLPLGLSLLTGCRVLEQIRNQLAPQPTPIPHRTLEEVIQTVNTNSSWIQSYAADQATLTGPGMPKLRASVAVARPKRLRLQAEFWNSPELDVGSNEELFWFWVKRNEQPGVYFCRHDQFAASPARRMVPIDPAWMIEALGLVEFDPALPHEGPITLPGGKLEVRTLRDTPEGPAYKSTIVDARQLWVLQQQYFNPQGQLIARSLASNHRRDPLTGSYIPGTVKIESPSADFSMRLDLGDVEVNRLSSATAQLWTVPTYDGAPLFDLGQPQSPSSGSRRPSVIATNPGGSVWR